MRPVFEYLDYRKFLRDSFEARFSHGSGLSYRTLGGILGMDGSNLNKVVLGKAHLPVRCQSRVIEFLGLGGREAEYFLLLLAFSRERGAKARAEIIERAKLLQDVARHPLEDQELLFYRDWWTSVIRSLLEVHQGLLVPDRLAELVSPAISPQQAKSSMDLLVELGLVKKSGSQRWKLSHPHVTASGEAKSRAIHAYQRQILELASRSLESYPREERDVSTLTVPIDDRAFAAIQDILRECRRRIQKEADATAKPGRVMQLAMAFFPVSRIPEPAP